jgi:ribosomal protein S8E
MLFTTKQTILPNTPKSLKIMKKLITYKIGFPLLYCLICLLLKIETGFCQCIPNNRATYNVNISGSTSNGGSFSRTAAVIVDPTITAAGAINLNNGVNDREVGIVSGFPGGNPEPGAIWFFTNTAMCRPLGTNCNSTPVNAALDVVFTQITGNKLTVTVDGTVYNNTAAGNILTANLLNNFSARSGVTASFYQIVSGTIELTFNNNGQNITGTINITGTSGLGGVGTSTYTATITGSCASGSTCTCSTLPNLTQETGSIGSSGPNVNYDISIVNNGTSNASSFRVAYYVTTDRASLAARRYIGQDDVSGLVAGRSVNLIRSINACNTLGINTGSYYFGYVIDSNNTVTESDENDNDFSTEVLQTVTCPLSQFQISVSAAPTNGGTVTGGGNFTSGQTATVVATPNMGWRFVNWTESGTIVSTNASFAFTVAANRTLVANFTQQSFTVSLSAAPTNGGTVTGGGNFTSGQTATVVATPNTGWRFVNWTESGTIISTNASFAFTVAANRTLVANFSQASSLPNLTKDAGSFTQNNNIVTVNLSIANDGTAASTPCKTGYYLSISNVAANVRKDYKLGETVLPAISPNSSASQSFVVNLCDLGTIPNGSFYLLYYIDDENTVNESNETDNGWFWSTPAITKNNCPLNNFTISASAAPTNSGTVTGGGNFTSGQTATIAATPNTGWQFVNWTEGGTIVSTNVSYTFTVSANRTLIANFTQQSLTISVSTAQTNGGTVSGSGNFASGQTATVIATPNAGWRFVNWTEGGVIVSTNASFSFTVSGARTLVANFVQQAFTISTNVKPNQTCGTISGNGTYLGGVEARLVASPNQNFTFMNWTEGGVIIGTNPTLTFNVINNRVIDANFVSTTSTVDLNFKSIKIAPSPNNGLFNLIFESNTIEGYHFTISNTLGQNILSGTIKSGTKLFPVEIPDTKGIYFIKLNNSSNKYVVYKFMIAS